MSRQISSNEWGRMVASIDGSHQHHNSQQQRLFRLFQAMRADDLDSAQELIDVGAPLDLPLQLTEEGGGPPRAEQFRFEELPMVKSLTILGYAAGRGEEDHVRWLLKRLAGVASPFAGGRDPAWIAMEMGQIDIMEFLLDRGAPVDARIKENSSPTRLIAATRASNLEAVKVLLSKKARVSAYDSVGRTALHYNFEKDPYTTVDQEIGRLLIDWGGIPGAMDQQGTTVADLAHAEPQYALLRAHGLERKLKVVEPDIPEPVEPEMNPDEPFDPKKIVRPAPDDPGLPQLNKAPVLKRPRF